MKDLTVVVPTMTNIEGLRYLVNYFKDKECQLIVVDNKPDHDKKNLLRMTRSLVAPLYLPQNRNLGFAAAVNHGVRHAKTKWLLLLNDDIEFKNERAVAELLEEARRTNVDALSPVLVNPDGRVENYGYRVLPYGRVELILDQNDRRTDGLTAACLIMKTKVFNDLKGFDESFFAYLEDVDFFMRFKKAGYEMAMSTREVKHNHMTTSSKMGNFKSRQDMFNWWRLYSKHKDAFVFDFRFIVERLKNVSGFLKATFKSG
jgi:GT2 family glycosyltransferase